MSRERANCAGTHLSAGFYFPCYKHVMAEFYLPDFELFSYFASIDQDEHPYMFFLESLTVDENARYSILGFHSLLQMDTRNGQVSVSNNSCTHYLKMNILEAQRIFLQSQPAEAALATSYFYGGMVGFWGYDLALEIAGINNNLRPAPSLPDAAFFVPGIVVVQDRLTSIIQVLGFYCQEGEEVSLVQKRVNDIVQAIMTSANSDAPYLDQSQHRLNYTDEFISNTTQAEYENMVIEAQKHIRRGDIFQAVLSQRWKKPTSAKPLEVYAELRRVNPSPYMFYLHFPDYTLVGSSPEMLVKVENGRIQTRPIAGTRPVTHNEEQDALLRRELAEDEKEISEHIMLVDLGRNDVGKVSLPGTVHVKEFMKVEAFSHVIHLVSAVEGLLKKEEDGLSALQACYPAGTLSGAPKRRAMEIIDKLEKDYRGPYGGAVGYMGLNGCLDTCITIRSVLFHNECCYIQAGAGIVADSSPPSEYQETVNKARALMTAILNVEG
ncbi:MAG: anthranilate synthase component I [Firmicutes bacterium HGW-Firmicutes-15]|nr:MAG: anthranilate synthase component I [Firmicutes bacterium HGW-Firmicutes-15]